jgi:AraC family transcriptional regulator
MNFDRIDADILSSLIGPVSEVDREAMNKNVECFLHPKVSLFIPSLGHCAYAVTPDHTHPAYTFIYYFSAVDDFVVEGQHMSYDLKEGKCLSAMSPGIPHQEIEEEFYQSYIAIAIEAALFEQTLLQYSPQVPLFRGEIFAPHPDLLGSLRCFMAISSENDPKNKELLDHLSCITAHLTARSVTDGAQQAVPLYDRFEVDRAVAYINSHFSEKITIEDLAGRVNLSAGHFSKIFKSITGETPNDFIHMLRLKKACTMLTAGEANITQTAIACGFNSSSYFSASFLEKYKMTPSAYRQRYSKK